MQDGFALTIDIPNTLFDYTNTRKINGKLSGTVQKVSQFVRKRVNLFAEIASDKKGFASYLLPISAIWSDSVTGAWEFTRLNPDLTYTIIIYDHLNEYDPIIRVGLVPELE